MMTRCTSMTIAFVLLMQLMLTPFTFAQTGEVSDTPATQEMEVCNLPWDDYKIFTNYRLGYQTAIADEDPVFAQDLFESMQDILASHCDAVASIIQVQSDEVDATCNTLMNHLIAKNNYYVRSLDTDNAIATQGLIQTVLTAQDCAPILAPDSEVAIDLIQEDIAAQQNTDIDMGVIPFESNVCFMQYGPAHAFTEQIQRVTNDSVLDNIYNTVATYMTNLDIIQIDTALQKEREGILLKFAKTVVQNQRLQWIFGNAPELQTAFTDQLTQVVQALSSVSSAASLDYLATVLQSDVSQIVQYWDAFSTLPVWGTYTNPADIIQDIKNTPMSFVYDTNTGSFVSEVTDQAGLSVAFPLGQEDILKVRIVDIELITTPAIYDDLGNEVEPEGLEPTKIVAEIYRNDKKIVAIDLAIDFDIEQNDVMGVVVALYMDPYIVTANYAKTFDEEGKESNSHVYNIYGPASCSMMMTLDSHEGPQDVDGNTIFQTQLNMIVDDMTFEATIQDRDAMISEIDQRRESVPTALSAPNSNNYVTSAKLYHKIDHIANIFAANDTWLINFTDNPYSNYNIFSSYIDPILALYPIQYDVWQQIIAGFSQGESAVTVIYGCTDSTALNYNPDATQDDGSCDYTPTNNNTGTGDATVLGCTNPEATNYDPNATKDDKTCTYPTGTGDANTGTGDANTGTGTNPVPGCTNPQATNYNSEATTDDGSCTLPSAGPVVGCMDDESPSYNPNATVHDWTMCQ